jgi:chromosome segregation ATPase
MQEYAWSTAIECEKKIENLEKEKRIQLKSKEKLETKVQESQENYKRATEEYEKLKLDINEIKEKTKELSDKHSQHEKEYKEKYQLYKQIQNDLKKYNQQIERKKSDREQLREKYEEEKLKNQKDFQEEKTQIELKISNLKQEIQKLTSQEKVKLHENQLYSSEIERSQKLHQERGYKINGIDKQIENLRAEMNLVKNSNKNKIYQFGDYMNDLCNEIKSLTQKGRFKQLPRGPIGMYIEPVKYEWALAIEQCLGGLVNSFICANYEDEKLLHQIIARYVKNPIHRPRVIVNNFNSPLYDVTTFVS